MNKNLIAPLMLTVSAAVWAKLPAPVLDDAAKAKAAEAAARTAWQGKIDAWQMCKSQDKVVAYYRKTNASAPKAAATALPAKPAASAESAPQGTPVASAGVPPTPCADPGPFAYNPPEQKPLETSGAHSPAGNATSPPSVKQESATMAPAKKS